MAVTNTALILKAFVTQLQTVIPTLKVVYDEDLSYETAIRKLRAKQEEAGVTASAFPLFVFKRSTLRRSEGYGKRGAFLTRTDSDTPDLYKSVYAEFDLEFLFVSPNMPDVENFEIEFLMENGLTAITSAQITIADLGTFEYTFDWSPELSKVINTDSNYYKMYSGSLKCSGLHLVLQGNSPLIKTVNLDIFNFQDTVLMQDTIIYFESMFAYYKLNNNTNDSSGNALTATATNVTYDSNTYLLGAYSAAMNGVDAYITPPAHVDFDYVGKDFTAAFWWMPTDGTTRQAILGTTSGFKFAIDYHFNGTRNVNVWASSNGSTWDILDGNVAGRGLGKKSLELNKMNHIVVRRRGNEFTTFINSSVDVTTIIEEDIFSNAELFDIGRYSTATPFPLGGFLDNASFFSSALKDSQIIALYFNGLGRVIP